MDKRKHNRMVVWFPVRLDTPEREESFGVTRNASPGGVLLVCNSQLAKGQNVDVTFKLTPDTAERTVKGKVVRFEENTEDPEGLWPHRVAVEFDQPIPEIETVLKASGQ